jgi:hypothetical protein
MCSNRGCSWVVCRVVMMAVVRSQSDWRVSFRKEVVYCIVRLRWVIKALLLHMSLIFHIGLESQYQNTQ